MLKPIVVLSLNQILMPEQRDFIDKQMGKIGIENDYYVFILDGCNESKVQVFSDKNIEPIELGKLKSMLNVSEEQSIPGKVQVDISK